MKKEDYFISCNGIVNLDVSTWYGSLVEIFTCLNDWTFINVILVLTVMLAVKSVNWGISDKLYGLWSCGV